MSLFDKVPLSLHKKAGDVIEFPEEKWTGEDPQRGSDLNLISNNIQDRVKAMLHYMEQTLEPGELHKFREAIENALVEFMGSIYRIEKQLSDFEEDKFMDPSEPGELMDMSTE